MVVNLLSSEDNLTKPHPPTEVHRFGGFSFTKFLLNILSHQQLGSEKQKRSPHKYKNPAAVRGFYIYGWVLLGFERVLQIFERRVSEQCEP